MVVVSYSGKEINAKLVYYGAGLCGKTTNLEAIYEAVPDTSRGKMVSMKTQSDRTLFFDLLPLDLGEIMGFKTRFLLYTVPGQVFYNTTRKLVLKGADGIVFVADSQRAMVDANLESLANLRENLSEIGLELDEIPLVLQLNKRDLPNVVPREELQKILDPEGRHEAVESSAVSGHGVFETLKLISKLTLKNLRKRMMGEEPATKIAPIVREHGIATPAPAADRAAAVAAPRPTISPTAPPVAKKPAGPSAPRPVAAAAAVAAPRAEPAIAVELPPTEAAAPTPPAPASVEPLPSQAIPAPAAAPEIARTAVEAPKPEAVPATAEQSSPADSAPEVKRVKVRSSVDVLAELDSLRRKATTQGARKKEVSPLDALKGLGAGFPSKKTSKSISLQAGNDASKKTRRIRITVQMEDEGSNPLQVEEQTIDVAETPGQVQVNLKIDFGTGQ